MGEMGEMGELKRKDCFRFRMISGPTTSTDIWIQHKAHSESFS
jgi:hypothetical protein